MKKTFFVIALIVCLLVVAIALMLNSRSAPEEHKPINVRLTWLHQAQFAGVYSAADQGFYESKDLDVFIKPGGIEYSSVKMVSTGVDDIGMSSADQILIARSKGVPLVALTAMYQKSPVVLFSLKENNIVAPEDLRGKKIGFKYGDNTEVPVRALLRKYNLNEGEYEEVPVSYDPTPLLDGRVDVLPGFVLNEPLSLKEKGHELNVIYLADYGINFYADVIFTREDILESRQEDIDTFLDATLEGFNYAITNPEDAIDSTMKRNPEANREHEMNMLKASIPLWQPSDDAELGHMDLENWETIQHTLIQTSVKDGGSLLKEPQNLQSVVRVNKSSR